MITKVLLVCISFFCINSLGIIAKTDSLKNIGIITPTEDSKSLSGWLIPKNLDDCIDELDNIFSEEIKDSIKLMNFDDVLQKVAYIRPWLINSWRLSDTSETYSFFSKYNITDPNEITKSILKLYWRYLNDLPMKLEIDPKYYIIGQNLSIKTDLKHYRYPGNPAIWGKIIYTGERSEFTLFGKKLKLLDSLYDPIMKLLYENGISPSERVLYIWWPSVANFGAIKEKEAVFLTEDEIENQYTDNAQYLVDYLIIIDTDYPDELEQFMRNYQYDDSFFELIKKIRNISFHLIKKREVVEFD